MPVVRLSGLAKSPSSEDPHRKLRAKLLYRLFDAGWTIYNGNGDQTIRLDNVQEKIVESDAFVFTPNPSIEDMFKAVSIFVGYQTQDGDLKGKPTVLIKRDGQWNQLITLIEHLNEMGTVHQKPEEYLTICGRSKEAAEILKDYYKDHSDTPQYEPSDDVFDSNPDKSDMPAYNVCVFCSASIKSQTHLDEGFDLGAQLAKLGHGVVSGAGCTGIMGKVVEGVVSENGWTGGSNVPHIIELEGLPDGLTAFWPRPDIYTRMQVMIDASDAFIIMPGGMGTVQEVLALLIQKSRGEAAMKDKPIIIVNRQEANGRFWDPLITMIEHYGMKDLVTAVDDYKAAIAAVKN